MSFFRPHLKELFALKGPFALSPSKGRAAQILTQPQHFVPHEDCGYMLRQAQHERVSFSVTPQISMIEECP